MSTRFTLEDLVGAVSATIPATLVDPASLEAIRAVARLLPGAVTTLFGFECPLTAPPATADLLLCSTLHEGHCEILAGRRPKTDLGPELLREPAWRAVRRLCLQWLETQDLHNVWLEFDLGGVVPARPLPSVFFGTRPPVPGVELTPTHLETTRRALGALLPETFGAGLTPQVEACFAALPAGAYVFQVGAMLARPTRAVRLCVRGLSPAQVLTYLGVIGWRGDRPALEALLADLQGHVDRIDLDFDVDAEVHDKLGLECYLAPDAKVRPRLESFTSRLVALGLCQAAKVEGLLAFSGISHERQDPKTWPENLLRASALLGPQKLSVIFRWLHHIKVVFQGGRATEAKAYLAVSPEWIDAPAFAALTAKIKSADGAGEEV